MWPRFRMDIVPTMTMVALQRALTPDAIRLRKRAWEVIQLREKIDNVRRKRYFNDPVLWARERLGIHLWSKQAEVARKITTNKRIAVRSCHAAGKSLLAAVLACWWVETRPVGEALVVTTAPSYEQVHTVLWEEIRRIHRENNLSGRVHLSDRWLANNGTLMGMGRKPPDYNPHTFQGLHRDYVLVILDEAAGVPAWLWTATEAITTTRECRMIAIGNPDDNASTFADKSLKSPLWSSYRISAFDLPTMTGEPWPTDVRRKPNLSDRDWIEDCKTNWGEYSPLYISKVLGEFADAEGGLIALSWVYGANNRWHRWVERGRPNIIGRRIIGVDPAHMGEDKTAIAVREANIVRGLKLYSKLDTTQTTSLTVAQLEYPLSLAVVDTIGIGAGVVDQLRAQGKNVYAYNATARTNRRDRSGSWRFTNVRNAAWWNVRELLDPALDPDLALPPDDNLTADLTSPTWEPRAGSVLMVESKDSVRTRLGRSTDAGDAVCQALWISSDNTRIHAFKYADAIQWN